MYYSAGTYEAFARPEKPEGADRKSAYIIGTGLAGLSAAFYLVRDGQVKGERIHLLEKLDLAGGSCDGRKDVRKGFYMRGGREMDNHFECMWDMFRDVPSIETPGVSVLDEYYWLNKHDPNYSLCRASEKCGQDAHTDKKFTLDKDSALALSKLFMTPEKDLEDKKISEILPDSFWDTNFWLYWQTMFAFQRWSSALEMKRYLCRYCHHIDGLPDFSALRFTKYNQYESMILPLVKYLESHGVSVEYGMDVKNVVIKDETFDLDAEWPRPYLPKSLPSYRLRYPKRHPNNRGNNLQIRSVPCFYQSRQKNPDYHFPNNYSAQQPFPLNYWDEWNIHMPGRPGTSYYIGMLHHPQLSRHNYGTHLIQRHSSRHSSLPKYHYP